MSHSCSRGCQSLGQSILPPELNGTPKIKPVVTSEDRELGKLMETIHAEKLSDSDRHALDAFIDAHPSYAGGYAMRAATACADEKPNLPLLESDLNQATGHPDAISSSLVTDAPTIRAKIAFAKGDYRAALDRLDAAALVDWSNAPPGVQHLWYKARGRKWWLL